MDTTDELRFDGRVAVVTGAGRGLGREFALLLARRGASVVVNDLVDAERTVGHIRDLGGVARAGVGDIGDPVVARTLVQLAVSTFGGIDIVINNAARLILKPFAAMSEDDLDATLRVNVSGAWYLTHAAWTHFRAQGYGRILMVSSMNGVVFATDDHTAYGASKGALAGLTRELSLEGRPHGILTNALLPGAATSMVATVAQSGTYLPPTGIAMMPALVAPAACWLVHEDCDASGQLVNASSARLGRVVTGLTQGFQSTPADFTLEAVRENWAQINADTVAHPMSTVAEYNDFRTARFETIQRGTDR